MDEILKYRPSEIAIMATASVNLDSQTLELERIRARCVAARDVVKSVRRQLAELTDQESELTGSIQSRYESELRVQLERMGQAVQDRLMQCELRPAAAR